MDCQYKLVKSNENEEKISSIPFLLRQLFISSAAWMVYFLCGLSFGIPTVMIPQLRAAANSTEAVSDEMASWLSSVFGYSALPWVVLICVFTRRFGRKLPFAIVCINTSIYYAVLYFSTTTTHVLISEIMQGMNHASNMTLSVIIVSEYTSPKYRGVFLAIKSATMFWGVWVANAIGTFFHWKNIPLLGLILSVYNLTVIFWPESPQWLASRCKFDECRIAHRWLRGSDKQSEKELEDLIQSQLDTKKTEKKFSCNEIIKTVSEKAFYKPLFLSIILMMQYQFSGKIVCLVYSIEIIKKITNSESTAYIGMLILDGVTVSGMYIGCVFSRILKRRTLLFSTSAVGIAFLFIISLYLYLIDLGLVIENNVVTIALLTCFSIALSCGPLILSTSIYGELIPLRYKSSCTMVSALIFVCLTSTLLKIFPYICKRIHMSGAFLFYAVASMICAVISYKYLPETKDRTLQEIEDVFNEKQTIKDRTVNVGSKSDI